MHGRRAGARMPARPVARGVDGRRGRGRCVGAPIVLARSQQGPYRRARRLVTVEPVLTAILPVYNGGREIVDNVGVIRRALADGLPGEDVEVIVVSDGSIDETAAELMAARGEVGFRVIHYDRNLGKGYAVKAGALAARGEWVALIDADLDLDPSSVPMYLEAARRDHLDFAIGSKRHPDSV